MSDSKPFPGKPCARHRRQPRHRCRDRRSARRGRSSRHSRCALRRHAGGGRGAHSRRRRFRDDRPARPHRRREHRQARRRGRGALAEARHPRPQRRDAGVAQSGAGHRPEGIFAAAQPQPACQPGADRGVRPVAEESERADVVALTSSVGAEPRAFWGAYGSSKAAVESSAWCLCRRDRIYGQAQGPHRRPRRDPHAHARACISGRGTGEREAAAKSSRGIVERLRLTSRRAKRYASSLIIRRQKLQLLSTFT